MACHRYLCTESSSLRVHALKRRKSVFLHSLCKGTKTIMLMYDCKSNNIISRCHRNYTEKLFCSTLIILLCTRTFGEKLPNIDYSFFTCLVCRLNQHLTKEVKQFLHGNYAKLTTIYFDRHLCD